MAKSTPDPDNSNKKITSYSETPIWTTIPATVKWLQKERNTFHAQNQYRELYERFRGINSTIILLSAACIEGFLVECLLSYAIGNRFASKETFEGRLDHDFLKRVSKAMFRDFPELFTLTLGKPLEELIENKDLIGGVKLLFNFRNGIAHGRSVVYQTYALDLEDDVDYEMGSQYKAIYDYLEKRNLIYRHEDIFKSEIADHFADLVKPYIEAVISLLPVPQSDNIKALVTQAYRDNLILTVAKT